VVGRSGFSRATVWVDGALAREVTVGDDLGEPPVAAVHRLTGWRPGLEGTGPDPPRFTSLVYHRPSELAEVVVLDAHAAFTALRDAVHREMERSRAVVGQFARVHDETADVEEQVASSFEELASRRGDPTLYEQAARARRAAVRARDLAEQARRRANR
jgi:hypothetical protein